MLLVALAFAAGSPSTESGVVRQFNADKVDVPASDLPEGRATTPKYSTEVRGTTITTTDLKDISWEEVRRSRPDELFSGSRRPLDPVRAPRSLSVQEQVTKALTGGDGINIAPTDERPADENQRAQTATWEAEAKRKNGYTSWDHLKAGFEETLGARMIKAVTDGHSEFDPQFMQHYKDNWQGIEIFAKTSEEAEMLREATSQRHLDKIKADIIEGRVRDEVVDSSGHGWILRLITNALTLLPLLVVMAGVFRQRKISRKVSYAG